MYLSNVSNHMEQDKTHAVYDIIPCNGDTHLLSINIHCNPKKLFISLTVSFESINFFKPLLLILFVWDEGVHQRMFMGICWWLCHTYNLCKYNYLTFIGGIVKLPFKYAHGWKKLHPIVICRRNHIFIPQSQSRFRFSLSIKTPLM